MHAKLHVETESSLKAFIRGDNLSEVYRNLRYLAAPKIFCDLGGDLTPNAPMEPNELAALVACADYASVRAVCDAIKLRRRESYPSDWWSKVQSTGIMASIIERTKSSDPEKFVEQTRALLTKHNLFP